MTQPNTEKIPVGADKFHIPEPPVFRGPGPTLSALSLLVFLLVSLLSIYYLRGLPGWAIAPFWATAFGAGLGFLRESWLIFAGKPFQLFATPRGRNIQTIRAGNLAIVFGSLYLAYCCLTFGSTESLFWLISAAALLTGFLLVMFFFQGVPKVLLATVSLGLIGQVILVVFATDIAGGFLSKAILVVAMVALYAAVIIGSQTPERSAIFHVVGTVVVGLLYWGFRREHANDNVSLVVDAVDIPWLGFLVTAFAGMLIAFYLVPITWGHLRSIIANATWPFFYLIVAGGLQIPRPRRLDDLYKGRENELKPLKVMPYYIAHPRNLTHPVSIPALDNALTVKVQAFGFLLRLVELVFGLASIADQLFPFANIKYSIKSKPRMPAWSDGSEFWPGWLLKRIYIPGLGDFAIQSGVQGPGFQRTPDQAIETYKQGQLLAYLVEYGVAGSFIKPIERNGKTCFELDFRFMEKYETKEDYESYGGTAYLEIDNKSFRLTHVRAPHSDEEIEADPTDPTFRHAEDMILATIYFYVVSGKHLTEIHMGLNLVEIALFNSFDAKLHWGHPVRMALYPHLFAHELAEELTTEHLLEDNATFSQIFATTNAALVRHLNDRFAEYQLGVDEDFEGREKVLLTGNEDKSLKDVVPNSMLIWEKRYAAIWQDYATALMDAAYADDAAVANDECVQVFYANLESLYQQPMHERYEKLQTKSGLSRFISDTMHHLIIRHEVYGTSGVRIALDPRVNKVQVPKDGGTYPVDEWRSLACIAMATSRVRYTKLTSDFKNLFDDLKDEDIRAKYDEAFDEMQLKLQQLQVEYSEDDIDNYNTQRLLPADLEIGAGY